MTIYYLNEKRGDGKLFMLIKVRTNLSTFFQHFFQNNQSKN